MKQDGRWGANRLTPQMEAWLCSAERKGDLNLTLKGGMSSEEKGGGLGQGNGVGGDLRVMEKRYHA